MHQIEFLDLELMFYFYVESQTALGNMNASENRKNGSHNNIQLPFANENLFSFGVFSLFNHFLPS